MFIIIPDVFGKSPPDILGTYFKKQDDVQG